MNVANIKKTDIADGTGVRVSLFVSGCTHHCKNCFNPETWDFGYGTPYTAQTEQELIDALSRPYIRGLTLLGGEPFEPDNQRVLVTLLRRVRKELPQKDIWCYTGYELIVDEGEFKLQNAKGETFTYPALKYIDVLVDGRFDIKVRAADIAVKKKVMWRGSSNQRLIDVQASLREGKIIVKEDK